MKPSNQSYYFQLHPSHLEVAQRALSEYPSSLQYRLAIFKGSQKCYAMDHSVQAKTVSSKIMFDGTILPFYLPIYSPNRNIEFILKAYKTQHENEVEIGNYLIKVNDLVRTFEDDAQKQHTATIAINQDVNLKFELFIEQSKEALENLTQAYVIENAEAGKTNEKKLRSLVTKSQFHESASDLSDISDISPKKKIQRKPMERRLKKQSSFKGGEKLGERSSLNQKKQESQIKLYQSERDLFKSPQTKTAAKQNNQTDEIQSRHSALSERRNKDDQFVLNDGDQKIPFKESPGFETLAKGKFEKSQALKANTVNFLKEIQMESCKSISIAQRQIRNPDFLRKVPQTDTDPSLKEDALQWERTKERIFYVFFTMLAVVLLLNALTPRKKV